MRALAIAALAITAALAACGSDARPRAAASGPLTPDELARFAHVPAGGHAIFGGDVAAVAHGLVRSPLATLAGEHDPASLAAFTACLAAAPHPAAGTATREPDVLHVRAFLAALSSADFVRCATAGGAQVDAGAGTAELRDGAYQLLLAFRAVDGGVYVHAVLLEAVFDPPAEPADLLAAERAGLATASAAADTRFHAVAAGLDRTRQLWFAGDASATVDGDRLGAFHGTLDVQRGLAVDVTAVLVPAGTAEQLHRRYVEGRQQLDMLPVGLERVKALVGATSIRRDRDALRVTGRYDDAMLRDLAGFARRFR